MKKIFLFILILCSVECLGQFNTAIKKYSDTSGSYLIRYRYNTSSTVVHNNKLHYDSKIVVLKILPTDTISVGEVFSGFYVAENCTDDNPKERIKYAYKSKDNK